MNSNTTSAASIFGVTHDANTGQFVPQFDGEHFCIPAVAGIAKSLKRDLDRIGADIWSLMFLIAFVRSPDARAHPKLVTEIQAILDDAAGGARAIREFFDAQRAGE